jgi:uncharacterized membrane protein YhiD involved in acid resistance
MTKIEGISFLEQYFSADKITGTLEEFILDTTLLLVLSIILAVMYVKFASSLSNRKKFASIFPLLSLTTMMIIKIISSSLALSLGLVGALSIIRFRSAIKEPEELAYIFLTISLGLGFGAGQKEITLIFFLVISIMLFIKYLLSNKVNFFNHQNDQNLYLNVTSVSKKINLENLINVLDQDCHFIDLKRMNEETNQIEFLFLIKVTNVTQLTKIKNNILIIDKTASVNILNDEGLFN